MPSIRRRPARAALPAAASLALALTLSFAGAGCAPDDDALAGVADADVVLARPDGAALDAGPAWTDAGAADDAGPGPAPDGPPPLVDADLPAGDASPEAGPDGPEPGGAPAAAGFTFCGRSGTGPFGAVAYAPDGALIAASTSSGLVQWVRAGDLTRARISETPTGGLPSFSADGALLATAHHGVVVQRVADGAIVRRIPAAGVEGLALFPDGAHVAIATSTRNARGAVQIVRVADGAVLRTLTETATYLSEVRIAVSPDGRRVATLEVPVWGGTFGPPGAGPLNVWDVESGRALLSATLEFGGDIAFSPDGKLFVHASSQVRYWSTADFSELVAWRTRTFEAPAGPVARVAFDRAGRRLLVPGAVHDLCASPCDAPPTVRKIPSEREQTLSPDGTEVLVPTRDGLEAHAVADWTVVRRLRNDDPTPFAARGPFVSSSGKIVAMQRSYGDVVDLWDFDEQGRVAELKVDPNEIVLAGAGEPLALLTDESEPRAPGAPCRVRLRRTPDGAPLATVERPCAGRGPAAIQPDGRGFAFGQGGAIHLVRTDGAQTRRLGPAGPIPLRGLAISGDGRTLVATLDAPAPSPGSPPNASLVVVDVATGAVRQTIEKEVPSSVLAVSERGELAFHGWVLVRLADRQALTMPGGTGAVGFSGEDLVSLKREPPRASRLLLTGPDGVERGPLTPRFGEPDFVVPLPGGKQLLVGSTVLERWCREP